MGFLPRDCFKYLDLIFGKNAYIDQNVKFRIQSVDDSNKKQQ